MEPVIKPQTIRLIDVGFLGPLMFSAGVRYGALSKFVRVALIVGGVATVVYNLNNYLTIAKRAP